MGKPAEDGLRDPRREDRRAPASRDVDPGRGGHGHARAAIRLPARAVGTAGGIGMKARRLFLLASLASFVAGAPAQPATDFTRLLHERLKTAPVLKGEFEQTKTLKGFKNPLVSRGEFLVARGQGVWWHTRQP